jgi:hypothetical protein
MEACVMAPVLPTVFDGSDETLISAVQTRQFFGGVSEMWIVRRKREREKEIARGGVPFPLGRFIGNREYFTLGELRRYRDSRPHFKVIDSQKPQHQPPSQSREAKAARAAKAAAASLTSET